MQEQMIKNAFFVVGLNFVSLLGAGLLTIWRVSNVRAVELEWSTGIFCGEESRRGQLRIMSAVEGKKISRATCNVLTRRTHLTKPSANVNTVY
jgi:hypothetical protein